MPAHTSSRLKRFLLQHSYQVDLVNALLIIAICLILLLPKVHESFRSLEPNPPDDEPINTASLEAGHAETHDPHQHQHQHHHHHGLPIGELLICAGFLTFYCIGMSLSGQEDRPDQLVATNGAAAVAERVSTVCCSSTRCPSSLHASTTAVTDSGLPDLGRSLLVDSHEEMLEGAMLLAGKQADEDCVMLLNKHHTHHTHSHHHQHYPDRQPQSTSGLATNKTYGTLNKSEPISTIYVEELLVTRTSAKDFDNHWPMSMRVASFSIIFALLLLLFDFNAQGLMEAVKVFRAASTGALLYLTFFVVFPKDPAGCNSCTEEIRT